MTPRGPMKTLSGWPIGSAEDMAYHRATGEQIPKEVVLDLETMGEPGAGRAITADQLGSVLDMDLFSNHTVITVDSYDALEKLKAADLPEDVEVVVIDPLTRIYDETPDPEKMREAFGRVAMSGSMVAAAAGMVAMGASMAEAVRHLNGPGAPATDYPYFEGYPTFEESSFLKPLPHPFDYPDDTHHYGRWAGRARQQNKRVGQDRARNKAARKARRNNRRK